MSKISLILFGLISQLCFITILSAMGTPLPDHPPSGKVPRCDEELTTEKAQLANLESYISKNRVFLDSLARSDLTDEHAEWHLLFKEKIYNSRVRPTFFQQIGSNSKSAELDDIKVTFETLMPNIRDFRDNIGKNDDDMRPLSMKGSWVDTNINAPRIVPWKLNIMQQCRHVGEQIQDAIDIIYGPKGEHSYAQNRTQKSNDNTSSRLDKLEADIAVVKQRLGLR